MNMKKSMIAVAVTGALAIPGAVMAQPTVYGKVNLGLLSANDDVNVNASGDANASGEISMVDGASRLGFMGDEDLGNGLAVAYRYELGVDATNMNLADNNRLSWVALDGDFGQVKAGRMWVGFYNHVGGTADLGDVIAAAPAYYSLGTAVSRVGRTIEYTGGAGAFEFTVGGVFEGENAADEEKEDIDRASVSASFDAGPVNIGVGHVSNSVATEPGATPDNPEPSMTGVAVTGSVANFGYGASYVASDRDDDSNSDSPSALDAYVSSDFGGGLSGFLGVSQFDNDQDDDSGDFTSFWGHIDRSLSSRTRIYGEFQLDSIDGGAGDDVDPQRIVVGINHAF